MVGFFRSEKARRDFTKSRAANMYTFDVTPVSNNHLEGFRTIQDVSGRLQDFPPLPLLKFPVVPGAGRFSLRSLRIFLAPFTVNEVWTSPTITAPKVGIRMTEDSARPSITTQQSTKHNALLAIAIGGGIAGTLDLLQACILFGWDIPLSIAGGLLGRQAVHGGVGTYVLGVALHFFIACSAAATYYAASRKLRFLIEQPLVCGLVFGAAVEEVMNLVVLPLSALRARGPYELHDLILGLLVHMVVVGLPVAYSTRRFGR